MKLMRKLINKLFNIILFWALACVANAQNLQGKVVDVQTGQPIPYASASYKGTGISCSADLSGQFNILRREGETLTVSAVGYKRRRVYINKNTPQDISVVLVPDAQRLEEVVVRAKRKRGYSRKNNPAVELMRLVIAAKKRTDLSNNPFYQYHKYQKVTTAVNDITPNDLQSGLFSNYPWLRNQIDTCPFTRKLILPVSVDETATRHIYRRNPRDEKDIVLGQSTQGVSKLIQTGQAFNTMVKDLFKDIDLYDDQINLLQKRFPSPIGSTAISFYHFYIDDTVYVDHDRCIRLQFIPANQQDFGFRGELYVLADSTLHVKKCDMQLPSNTGVNFVEAMRLEQEYSRLANGEWVLTTDNMIAELELNDRLSKAVVIRQTQMSDYSFGEIPDKEFRGKAEMRYLPNAKMQDEAFWQRNRKVQLSKGEAGMNTFVRNLYSTPHFKWIMFGAKALIENFIETGSPRNPSKIDLGPVNTLISKNYVDGLRLRLSARTTAKLNPHFFWEGYYAYGTDSHRHYYDTKFTYSFNKPEYQPIEFPIRTLSFETTRDVMSWSDKYLKHNKDNIFMTFRPSKVEEMFFYNRQMLDFKWETEGGLATELSLKAERQEPAGTLAFNHLPEAGGTAVPYVRTTELLLGFDYRPGQTYINSKQNRIEVNLDAPQFTLQHAMGLSGVLGGQYRYNQTDVSAYKRLWLGSWGHIDVRAMAGAQWNKVPYVLLIMPPVNTSYFEHQGSFNMMENMEFLNDRYAQFNLAWDLTGKIFNRVPLLKRLKWREYIAFKGMWGTLTDKNNPFLERNRADATLFQFPAATRLMTSDPYLEAVVGIHNILKCLEIDYVRRLTYTGYPGVKKGGIRLGFNLVF